MTWQRLIIALALAPWLTVLSAAAMTRLQSALGVEGVETQVGRAASALSEIAIIVIMIALTIHESDKRNK